MKTPIEDYALINLPVPPPPAAERRGTTWIVSRAFPESQGHNLALSVVYVPYSLDSGTACACGLDMHFA